MLKLLKTLAVSIILGVSGMTPTYSQTSYLDSREWSLIIKNEGITVEYDFDGVIFKESYIVIPVRISNISDNDISFFFVQMDIIKEFFGNFRRVGIMIFTIDGTIKYQDRNLTEWSPLADAPVMTSIVQDLLYKMSSKA